MSQRPEPLHQAAPTIKDIHLHVPPVIQIVPMMLLLVSHATPFNFQEKEGLVTSYTSSCATGMQ